MNRQLLNNNDVNMTFTDANQTQPGIELYDMNTTQNGTSRAGYVNLDDINDNVVYADKEAQKKYESLQNEDPYSIRDDSDEEQAPKKNLINKPQQEGGANKYPVLDQKQQVQQKPQAVQPQVQPLPSAFQPQAFQKPIGGNTNNFGYFPQFQQQPMAQSQYFQPPQQGGMPYNPQQQVYHNQQFVQQNPQNAAQFGMGQMSQAEFQQTVQMQQKMFEEYQRQRLSQNQPNNNQQHGPPPQQSQIQQQSQLRSQLQPNQSQRPLQSQIHPQQEIQGKIDVKCQYCCVMQRIPMTSKKFQCYNCQNVQEAHAHVPVYSMFSCGKCQARVLYEPGVSELICCTRCQTVNKVSMNAPNMQQKSQIQQKKENPNVQQNEQHENLSEEEIKKIEQQFAQIDMNANPKKKSSFDEKDLQNEQFLHLQRQSLEQIELLKKQQQLLQQQIEQKQQVLKQQQSVFSSSSDKAPPSEVQQVQIPPSTQSKYPVFSLGAESSNVEKQPQTQAQTTVVEQKQQLLIDEDEDVESQDKQEQLEEQQHPTYQSVPLQQNFVQDQQEQPQIQQPIQDNNQQFQNQNNNQNYNSYQPHQQVYQNQEQQSQQQFQQQYQQYQPQQQQQQQQQQQNNQDQQSIQRSDRGFSIFEEHEIQNDLL